MPSTAVAVAPAALDAVDSPPSYAALNAPHVSGDGNLNTHGGQVLFHGINRFRREYRCVQGSGIFDGATAAEPLVAIARWWYVNIVCVRYERGPLARRQRSRIALRRIEFPASDHPTPCNRCVATPGPQRYRSFRQRQTDTNVILASWREDDLTPTASRWVGARRRPGAR